MKTPVPESLFNKVELRTPFLTEHFRWLLLNDASLEESFDKRCSIVLRIYFILLGV